MPRRFFVSGRLESENAHIGRIGRLLSEHGGNAEQGSFDEAE